MNKMFELVIILVPCLVALFGLAVVGTVKKATTDKFVAQMADKCTNDFAKAIIYSVYRVTLILLVIVAVIVLGIDGLQLILNAVIAML